MNEFLNNPLLKVDNIHKVINDVEVDSAEYRGMEILPFNTTEDDEIKVDVQKLQGGMTQAVARGAESPVIERRGVRQFRFIPACFREKLLLSSDDLTRLRKLGTVSERQKAAETIAKASAILRDRVEARIEWARWQAIQGSLSVSDNEVIYDVDYAFPSANTPTLTGTDKWSDTTNSDPINDIMDWIYLFRGSGISMKKIWFNSAIEKYLFQNTRIRGLLDRVMGQESVKLMSRKILKQIMNLYIGDYEYEVYDKGYWLVAEVTSAVTAGDTAITVNYDNYFASGDSVTIKSYDGQTSETATVDNVNGANVITVTSGVSNSYSVGAEIRIWKPFIPDTKVILEGTLPVGALGGTDIGEFISTVSEYGAGTPDNPKPGVFGEVQNHYDEDPKYIAVIGGVYGLPVLYRNDAIISATVA